MKIETLETVLTDLDDQPIPAAAAITGARPERQLKLRDVIADALTNRYQDDEDGKKMHARYRLAKRIKRAEDAVEITIEDCAEIKATIAKRFTPLILGQAYDLIEGEGTE